MAKFDPGHILRSPKGNEYIIICYLGEGVTAQVYLAERTAVPEPDERFPQGSQVALKVLQDNLPEDIVQNFRDEAVTLRELFIWESKVNQNIVPRLLETVTGSHLPQEFLVMEFVTGYPLDKFIEAEGPLPEQEVLLIASQVVAVLDILHTQVRKSYTDFQLQNIWWQPKEHQIKMMDWNHVSVRAAADESLPEAWVIADLTRLGAYLYQMLTGKGALQSGETAHALARRAGMRWVEISTGTRAIICQALHLNPSRRFTSARAFQTAVAGQQKLWDMAEEDLDMEVLSAMRPLQRSLSKGEAIKDTESVSVEEAEILVDMLGRRRPGNAQATEYQGQLEELTGGVSATWAAGRQYYKAGIFSRVLEAWLPQAEALGRVDLWRWVMAAQIGHEVGESAFIAIRADLDEGVQQMNQGVWKNAQEYLERVAARQDSTFLSHLRYETEAHQIFWQAQIHEEARRWSEAAGAYRQIVALISDTIPYANLLHEEYGWQPDHLNRLADQCDQYARDSAASSDLYRSLQAMGSFESLVSRLREAFWQDPANPSLLAFCEEEASHRPPAEALFLLGIPQLWGQPDETSAVRLRRAWQQAKEQVLWEQAEAALRQENWLALPQILSELQQKPPYIFREKLRRHFDTAVTQQSLLVAQQLFQALALIEDETERERRQRQLAEMRENMDADRQTAVDNLLLQVDTYQANGQHETAVSLLTQTEQFFADQPEQLSRIQALQPQAQHLRQMQMCLQQASSLLDQDPPDDLLAGAWCQKADEASHQIQPEAVSFNELQRQLARLQSQVVYFANMRQAEQEKEGKGSASNGSHNGSRNGFAIGFVALGEAMQALNKRMTWLSVAIIVILLITLAGIVYVAWLSGQERQQLALLQAQVDEIGTRLPSVTEVAALLTTDGGALPPVTPADTPSPTATATFTPTPTDTPTPTPTDTPMPTPAPPLPVLTQLISPEPSNQPLAFYDLPDMALNAPTGWYFDVNEEGVQLVDEAAAAWAITLVLTPTNAPVTNTLVPMNIISYTTAGTPVTTLTITWGTLTGTTPLLPDDYQAQWQFLQESEIRFSAPITFAIQQPLTVTIPVNGSYRFNPVWDPGENVVPGGVPEETVVEVIGKRTVSQEGISSFTPPRSDAVFLQIRLPGTRQLYWLADQHTKERGDGTSEFWTTLLNIIPDV